MKRLTFSVCVLAANAGGAFAADLPARPYYTKAPPAAATNWTGFYIGGTAGAAWSRSDVGFGAANTGIGIPALYSAADIQGLTALASTSLKQVNAIFGGKIGYNWQQQSYVLGLEADYSSFRFNSSSFTTGTPFGAFPGVANFNSTVSTTWLATVRARVGYAVERALIYGTAGAAFSNVSFSNTYAGLSTNGQGAEQEASSASQTKTGWAIGGGVDYALTPNWIMSAEYIHVDLGSINAAGFVAQAGPAKNAAIFNFSTSLKSDILRVGGSYKF